MRAAAVLLAILAPTAAACQEPAPPAAAAEAPAGDAAPAPPPSVTLPRTELHHLPSRHVPGVTYELRVALPRHHGDDPAARHPTLYLLDADYSFALARNIVEHLSDRGDLPPMIVVAVAYADPLPGSDDDPEPWKASYRHHRTRDYTPVPFPSGGYGPRFQRHSGGGPAFRRFLAEELIPYVERTFQASPERTLVGHSYGGLFATWVALTTPKLFDHYIAVSPSLWYADRWIFGAEAAWAAAHDDLPATLFLAVGDHERNRRRDMVADLRALAERLAGRGYHGLDLHVEVLDDETHNSVFPRALSDGLRATWPR